MKTDQPIADGPPTTSEPQVRSKDWLECAIAELCARRGNAEIKALEMRRLNKQPECDQWQCRAAGLSEAIAVVQMMSEAAHSNAAVSEVAVAGATKTCGVRPPLSLD